MKKVLLAALISGFSTAAIADYRAEISGEYYKTEVSEQDYYSTDTYEDTTYIFTGTLYFSPVSTDNVPVGEAGFLSQESSITLSNGIEKSTNTYNYQPSYGGSYSSEYRNHYRDTGLSYRGVYGNAIVNVEYSQSYYGGESGGSLRKLGGGAYINENSALTAYIVNASPKRGDSETGIGVNYHFVTSNNEKSNFSVDVELLKIADLTALHLEGGMYFTSANKLYLEVNRAENDDDYYDDSYDEFAVGYEHFFNEKVGLSIRYANGNLATPADEKEGYLTFGFQVNL